MRESSKGSIPWNKGKIGIYSKETLEKMSNSLKGRTVWNKGLKGINEPKIPYGNQCYQWKGGGKSYARYRAQKRGLKSTLTEKEWQILLKKFNYSCAYCGKTNIKLVQEHVIPVSQGGEYTRDNIVPSCDACNKKKWARTPEEAGMKIINKIIQAEIKPSPPLYL